MKKVIIPISIILFASALSAAMIWQKKMPEKKETLSAAMLVETMVLKKQDVTFTISSQGSVSPRTETTLVSEISGVVLEVSPQYVAGGLFNKGDVLLRLDPTDYEVALQQARASLLSMKAKLTQEKARAEQAKKEWDMSGRSRSEAPLLALRTPYMEEAKANVLFAEADLKKAKRKLELTQIRAPYDGMVKDKLVDIGQYVSIGTALTYTFAVDFAEVRLPLTDHNIAYIDLPKQTGQTGSSDIKGPNVELISIIGGKDYHWDAHIVRTEGVIDKRTRVHYAVARIADPYGLKSDTNRPPLSIGSFVKAIINGRTANNVIAIPRHSIRGKNQIMLMDEQQQLRLREVNVVHTDNDYVYSRDTSLENMQVITSAVEVPVDGMSVRTTQDI